MSESLFAALLGIDRFFALQPATPAEAVRDENRIRPPGSSVS